MLFSTSLFRLVWQRPGKLGTDSTRLAKPDTRLVVFSPVPKVIIVGTYSLRGDPGPFRVDTTGS